MFAETTRHSFITARILASLLLAVPAAANSTVGLPGPSPGRARAEISRDKVTLENAVISCTWELSQGKLRPARIVNKQPAASLILQQAECFLLVLADGSVIKASDFEVVAEPALQDLEPNGKASRLAERFAGRQVTEGLSALGGNLRGRWRAILRDGSNYVRQQIELRAVDKPVPIKEIVLLEMAAPDAEVVGTVDGSPVVADDVFFAAEHPMAKSRILQQEPRRFRCSLARGGVLRPGERTLQSSVIGVAPKGQLRRGFLYYIERERAHPYRAFLHYNSWYDIGYGPEKIYEPECLKVIAMFGKELITRRKVVMDSFALDDGWDDTGSLWRFHEGFPDGFSRLQQAAEGYGSSLGAWLSPWGGYGRAKKERMEYGRAQGFETNKSGFSLAGRRYYARFRDTCAGMVRDYGLNYFKFDGIGVGGRPAGAPGELARDIDGLLRLISELRRIKGDLFVNVTTGTWPSPYWLWYGDSTWRSGADWRTHGWGSKRQQQITYRDKETYHNIVVRAPLYPLNSLMTQGVMFANHGLPNESDGLAEDIRAFFACGTNCQELYISPSLLDPRAWDVLAEAAKWSRANSDVLVDTHWIGGDPAKGQVYGWASWSARKGILALRNPHEKPGKTTLDIGKALELPEGARPRYMLKSPWKEDAGKPAILLSAGAAHTFELQPFEVLVYDATAR